MTTRSHELVIVPGKKSRLTVTPTRLTVKVSRDTQELSGELFHVAQQIAGCIHVARSMRGTFSLVSRTVTLRSNSKDIRVTFNFDGETFCRCGKQGELRVDPFIAEIHNEIKEVVLCEDCYQTRSDDI